MVKLSLGHLGSYTDQEFGKPEVTYWIGKEFWGKGVETEALLEFLKQEKVRPMYARCAKQPGIMARVGKIWFQAY